MNYLASRYPTYITVFNRPLLETHIAQKVCFVTAGVAKKKRPPYFL
jgi:hypothetical protein